MGPHFNSPDIPFSTEATRDGGSSQFEDLSTDILDSAALKHLDLTNSVKLGEWLGQGSFATVFLGRMEDRTVCVKVLRIVGSMSNTDARKALDQQAKQELMVWFPLKHPNILPLIGYSIALGPSLSFISPYIPGGNAQEFLCTHPLVDRFLLVVGICEGLKYLHSRDIIHGDIKGVNILISGSDSNPIPVLSDFGLSKAPDIPGFTVIACGTTNWTAKELLEDDKSVPTQASDIWSLGMMIYELFTERAPYEDLPYNPLTLANRISNGALPTKPDPIAVERGLTPGVWDLLHRCWSFVSESRPSASDVIPKMRGLRAAWKGFGVCSD